MFLAKSIISDDLTDNSSVFVKKTSPLVARISPISKYEQYHHMYLVEDCPFLHTIEFYSSPLEYE